MSTTHDALCLACSSSLPPLKNSSANIIYTTNCCQRPICPSCIASNPRLARYDPCLACIGGVGIIASSSNYGSGKATPLSPNTNLNGAVRDQDTFVLGDSDEEDEEGDGIQGALPPVYEATIEPIPAAEETGSWEDQLPPPGEEERTRTTPYKYYINRSDTLQGLSLRFGVESHEICKLNNLPASVMRTTPHLLHTRSFLILPPSTKPHPSLILSKEDEKGREEKLVRASAEKKLQMLTKEVDWRIAKAYVALADDDQEQVAYKFKRKEMGSPTGATAGGSSARGLEALAVERYLDDEEWEAAEIRAGRGVQVNKFPFADFGRPLQSQETKGWW